MIKKPTDLLSRHRIDVIIKYMYAKSILQSYNTSYYKQIYKQHLKVWNGFKEKDNPNKQTFEAFDTTFKNIITSINLNGFDSNISNIPILNNSVLNGAHRLAACLATNNNIHCIPGVDGLDGCSICDFNYLTRKGLDTKYTDRVAIEYTKLKHNTYMCFLFPVADIDPRQSINILNSLGNIIHLKQLDLNYVGVFNLMRELYLDEPWVGCYPDYGGYNEKAKLCYTHNKPVIAMLIEFNDINDSIEAKRKVRDIYKLGNHSIHINDKHEETVRLSKLMFNNNSIHHLCNMKPLQHRKFDMLLKQFKSYIHSHKLDIDNYCISASSVLTVYGLREGHDIDYIHTPSKLNINNNLISSHNEYGINLYPIPYDDIIHDPSFHFYYRGVKFASLEAVKQLKLNRGESKDKIDIELINGLII